MMQLKTNRLEIRYVKEADWKSLIAIWDDFRRSEFAKFDAPHSETEPEAREKAKRWSQASPNKEHLFFAVCLADKMIGYADFHRDAAGYECGYCFHSAYHGKGYAKEGMAAMIEWLSGNQEMRFTARTALENIPSVRFLESMGFVKTGEEVVSFYQDDNGNDICFIGGIFTLDRRQRI